MKVHRRPVRNVQHERRRVGAGVGGAHPPKRSCLTTGWSASAASIPTPRSTCCGCPTTIRRRACWHSSWPSSRPTRIGPSCRCGCSGCLADCRRAPRWCRFCRGATPTGPLRFCSAASCARTLPGAGCRRGTRESIGTAAAVGRHDGRRELSRIRAIRHPPRGPGDRTRRAAPARSRIQVAASDQTGTVGVVTFS